MLIIGYEGIGESALAQKYPDKVRLLELDKTKISNDTLIEYIELIKESLSQFEIVIIPYVSEVILCLDTLTIPYVVAYPTEMDKDRIQNNIENFNLFKALATNHNNIVLQINETLEMYLQQQYEWIDMTVEPEHNIEVIEETPPAIDKKNLTLQELIENDVDITESDIRDLKSTTNKFKVAMLLQAKSRLSMVLKLCDILDKLYSELVDRIDLSLKTTDTASLMYTADYISKALNDTNQFIMSLITNEKIQNFFIIDNSSIINITDNRIDIDKREKIRKAAEIVLDNADYFTTGQFDKVINPNVVLNEQDKSEVDDNANIQT